MKQNERHKRNINIVCAVIEGKTMVNVSIEYALSFGSVRQICNKYLRRTKLLRPEDTTIWNARKDKDRFIEIIKALK
jgi:hypothetical protein